MPTEVSHDAMKRRFASVGAKTTLLLVGDHLYLRDGDVWVLLP